MADYWLKSVGTYNVRPDFVNYKSRTIYELKPYNPRGIKSGIKQLNRYKLEYEKFYNNNWKTVLEFY
ncbi:MAG: hypothetical protein J5971_01720 [Prevotella sp.]|nr:hypothetical protein [Prevotella sp.]